MKLKCLKPLFSIMRVRKNKKVTEETVFSRILKNQQSMYEGEYQQVKMGESLDNDKVMALIELVG